MTITLTEIGKRAILGSYYNLENCKIKGLRKVSENFDKKTFYFLSVGRKTT